MRLNDVSSTKVGKWLAPGWRTESPRGFYYVMKRKRLNLWFGFLSPFFSKKREGNKKVILKCYLLMMLFTLIDSREKYRFLHMWRRMAQELRQRAMAQTNTNSSSFQKCLFMQPILSAITFGIISWLTQGLLRGKKIFAIIYCHSLTPLVSKIAWIRRRPNPSHETAAANHHWKSHLQLAMS